MNILFRMLPLFAMLSFSLTACTTDTNPGLPPSDYRRLMKTYINKDFFDPYSLRDVALSEPVAGQMYGSYGWIVCLQANAKNRMGGYIGLSKTAYLIKNNAIATTEKNSPFCETVPLQPWPEMESDKSSHKDKK